MGRPEKPLDPGEGPVQHFACELRALRADAGSPTYRSMACRAHYSPTALAQAAAGDRLPSLAVVMAFVRACGGNADDWQRRWSPAAEKSAPTGGAHDRPPGSTSWPGAPYGCR